MTLYGVMALCVLIILGMPWLSRASPLAVGEGLLISALISMSWNAVELPGGFAPSDLLMVSAIGVLLVLAVGRSAALNIPIWISIPTLIMIVLALSHSVLPVSEAYLDQRFRTYSLTVRYSLEASVDARPLVSLIKWLVGFLALPVMFLLTRAQGLMLRPFVLAWALGIAASCGVAVIDFFNVTNISENLLGVSFSGREAGLTVQPNHVAVSGVMALPVLLWWAASPGRFRLLRLVPLCLVLGGIFASGSRGGAAATVLVLALSLKMAQVRRGAAWLLGANVLGLPFVFGSTSDAFTGLAAQLRLSEIASISSEISNGTRLSLARQGLADFIHRPVDGVGFQVLVEAHSIYLQLLASGGMILLSVFLIYNVCAIRELWRARKLHDELPLALLISMGGWLVIGLVENQLTDRYLYVPAASAAVLWLLGNQRRERWRSSERQAATSGVLGSPLVGPPPLFPECERERHPRTIDAADRAGSKGV
jgi:hypothetical protein